MWGAVGYLEFPNKKPIGDPLWEAVVMSALSSDIVITSLYSSGAFGCFAYPGPGSLKRQIQETGNSAVEVFFCNGAFLNRFCL